MNSKFKEVAELLGVQLGEPFKVKRLLDGEVKEGCLFYLDEEGLKETEKNDLWHTTLLGLLRGEYEIIKLPFKPKLGDTFYYITFIGVVVSTKRIEINNYDLALICMGNAFRTKEEAEAHKDEIMSKFKEIESNVSRN